MLVPQSRNELGIPTGHLIRAVRHLLASNVLRVGPNLYDQRVVIRFD